MRRWLPLLLAVASLCFAQSPKPEVLRGRLTQGAGGLPSLETADHKLVELEGDADTRKVLADARLNGYELEAKGHYTSPGHFLVDPIHTKAVMVRKDGRLKYVTYWCDVCSIRSYAPGPCWCCQEETTLDLRDPDQRE